MFSVSFTLSIAHCENENETLKHVRRELCKFRAQRFVVFISEHVSHLAFIFDKYFSVFANGVSCEITLLFIRS